MKEQDFINNIFLLEGSVLNIIYDNYCKFYYVLSANRHVSTILACYNINSAIFGDVPYFRKKDRDYILGKLELLGILYQIIPLMAYRTDNVDLRYKITQHDLDRKMNERRKNLKKRCK